MIAVRSGLAEREYRGEEMPDSYALEHYLHYDGADIHTGLVNRGQRRAQRFPHTGRRQTRRPVFLRHGQPSVSASASNWPQSDHWRK
jgi:hypothetical protein